MVSIIGNHLDFSEQHAEDVNYQTMFEMLVGALLVVYFCKLLYLYQGRNTMTESTASPSSPSIHPFYLTCHLSLLFSLFADNFGATDNPEKPPVKIFLLCSKSYCWYQQ